MEFFPFPADIDPDNFAEAIKNSYSMAGAVGGMLLVSLFDNRLLQFPNRAPWWGHTAEEAYRCLGVSAGEAVTCRFRSGRFYN